MFEKLSTQTLFKALKTQNLQNSIHQQSSLKDLNAKTIQINNLTYLLFSLYLAFPHSITFQRLEMIPYQLDLRLTTTSLVFMGHCLSLSF